MHILKNKYFHESDQINHIKNKIDNSLVSNFSSEHLRKNKQTKNEISYLQSCHHKNNFFENETILKEINPTRWYPCHQILFNDRINEVNPPSLSDTVQRK